MHDEMHITEAQAVYLEKFLHFKGSIESFAAEMDVPLVDMIDILSAKPVKKRIKAAAKLTNLRRDMVAANAEITALETLQQIAANRNADIVERRRAASNILRVIHKPRRPSRPRRHYSNRPSPPDDPDSPGEPIDQIVPQSSCTQEVCVPDQTAQNAAIYCPQEFLNELHEARKNSPASNMTSSQVCTSDLVDADALHPQEETTKLLEETTQSLIELDELCAQDDQDDFDPTPHPRPNGASESSHGWSADEVETEPVDSQQNTIAPEGQAKRTQAQDASRSPQKPNHNKPHFTNPTIQNEPTPDQTLDDYDPKTGLTIPIKNHTSKHQQNNHKKPYPEKDNPWESHPFARAGRTTNHDPP